MYDDIVKFTFWRYINCSSLLWSRRIGQFDAIFRRQNSISFAAGTSFLSPTQPHFFRPFNLISLSQTPLYFFRRLNLISLADSTWSPLPSQLDFPCRVNFISFATSAVIFYTVLIGMSHLWYRIEVLICSLIARVRRFYLIWKTEILCGGY